MHGQVYVQYPTNWRGVVLKVIALAVLFLVTSFGFWDRVSLLWGTERWFTLTFYLGVWGVSAGALLIAGLQPKYSVRLAWAILLSFSTAMATFYLQVSGKELSVFDALSLWAARNNADQAASQYAPYALTPLLVFAASLFIIAAPPVPQHRWIRLGLKWLSWTPAVPVILIAIIIFLKEGGGSQALPLQFQPLAVTAVTGIKVARQQYPERQQVAWVPVNKSPVKHLVLLVDESVRAEYINLQPGNPFTPEMAAKRDRFVNFGHAASGGNCSSYSNAILRFASVQTNLVGSSRTYPTIWQYAKKAGYRTVYIDGQSMLNKDPGAFQNFMTLGEAKFIDRIVRIKDVPNWQLDFELLKTIQQELKSDEPVFIYANKQGAHFPYDSGYPKSQTTYRPTQGEQHDFSQSSMLNSYLNVIKWSVDHFMGKFLDETDLKNTLVLYTSDHGQNFSRGKLTHCSTSDADPREGLVPMLVTTGNEDLLARFRAHATENMAKTSHFNIAPTILNVMGFDASSVQAKYGASLFDLIQNGSVRKFSSGDIFGVFRNDVHWTPLDLSKDYFEYPRQGHSAGLK